MLCVFVSLRWIWRKESIFAKELGSPHCCIFHSFTHSFNQSITLTWGEQSWFSSQLFCWRLQLLGLIFALHQPILFVLPIRKMKADFELDQERILLCVAH